MKTYKATILRDDGRKLCRYVIADNRFAASRKAWAGLRVPYETLDDLSEYWAPGGQELEPNEETVRTKEERQ